MLTRGFCLVWERRAVNTALKAALWISLGGWFGALTLFAVGVAPLVFTVVPPGEAARIVGPLLRGLNYYGIAAGVLLAALAFRDARGYLLVGLAIVLVLLCGVSEFAVTAEIARVRPNAFGTNPTESAASSFALLHQLSRALYFCVMTGVIALAVLHARFEASRE